MEYWRGGTTRADRIYTPTVDGSAALQKSIIYYYHNWSNNPPDTVRHYIGIGVTKDPRGNSDEIAPDFDAIWDNSSLGTDPDSCVTGAYISADDPAKDEPSGSADQTGAKTSPETGDNFPVLPLTALALLASLAGAVTLIIRRKTSIDK